MECPVCGHDEHRILYTTRKADGDERLCECAHCGSGFFTRTTVSDVRVRDPDTMRVERVEVGRITEGYRDYLLGRGPHPRKPYRT